MYKYLIFSILLTTSTLGGIHGPTDDRVYSVDHRDQKLVELANATAAMLPANKDNSYNFVNLQRSKGMCSYEKFSQAPSISKCTGVLIAKDKILTAGHCIITEEQCKRFNWTFDFNQDHIDFNNDEVYHCKRIVDREKNYLTHRDFAIIQLDREVLDRKPVSFDSNEIKANTPLAIIGHPMGLPSITSDNAVVLSNNHNDQFFTSNLDSFAGNSGAPVFNLENYKLAGILIRGGSDLDSDFDSPDMCRTWFKCSDYPNTKCETEDVFKITKLLEGINL